MLAGWPSAIFSDLGAKLLSSPRTTAHRTQKSSIAIIAIYTCATGAVCGVRSARAQTTLLSQDFESTSSFTDYYVANNSDNARSGYAGFQFASATTVTNYFAAQSGTSTSYVYSDYEAIAAGNTGTISTWLITPTLTYQNGDVISFYTRTSGNTPVYPDRLVVRFSSAGSSTNVGSSASDFGDFTTPLLTINPNLTTTDYPATWTQYTATISGLSAPTSGRVAFNYYVTNGGPTGSYSDFIGLDTLLFTRGAIAVPEPSGAGLICSGVLPLFGILSYRRTRNKARL